MTNYIEYLCDLYVKFIRPVEPDENSSWAKLGKHIKTKFHLKKRTRNHLSAERFWDLVDFLVNEKLAQTPVGRKHLREGKKLCRTSTSSGTARCSSLEKEWPNHVTESDAQRTPLFTVMCIHPRRMAEYPLPLAGRTKLPFGFK